MTRILFLTKIVPLILLGAVCLHAQRGGGRGGAQQTPTAKAGAPIDLTGYWVSLVTQDWRLRMFTPPKGDYAGIPLNAEARKIADGWDPAKDEAAGEQCRSYGAPTLMRIPGRLHITWQDDQTLKIEADSGTQTRIFLFSTGEGQAGTWQGISKASWEYLPAAVSDTLGAGRGSIDRRGGPPQDVPDNKKLPDLSKKRINDCAEVRFTLVFHHASEPHRGALPLLTSTVEDPTYLAQPLMFSTQFKKQADASGWNPTPCAAK